MKFNGLRLLSMLLVSSLNVVLGHDCINVEPMEDFKMEKFLGRWYVIKTTMSNTRCLLYDIYTQKIKNLTDYAAKSSFNFLIFGVLDTNTRLPSDMTYFNINLDYSTNPEEKTSFIVFDTNYESYAGVFLCSKTPTGFNHYVAIMSRSVNYNKEHITQLLQTIYYGHISPVDFRFNHVDHKDCNYENSNENSNDENVINKDGKVYVTIKLDNPEPIPNP